VKIGGNLKKFWQKEICTVFSETQCIYICLSCFKTVYCPNVGPGAVRMDSVHF